MATATRQLRTIQNLCISEEEQLRLVRILNNLFLENPDFDNLKTNISFDKISSNGSIHPIGKLTFVNSSDQSDSIGITFSRTYGYSTIRFVEFSPRDISSSTLYNTRGNSSEVKNLWSNVYNEDWEARNSARRLGINVMKKISIKGYILNFNDVRKLIDENVSSNSYDSVLDNINEFYYFSNRNCLLGISTANGSLLIRLQAIKKILEQNDDETVKVCLRNVFVCFNKVLSKFIELNVREVHSEVAEIVNQSVLNRMINSNSQYNRRFYRFNTEGEDKATFQKNIDSYVKECLKNAFEGSVFGVDDQYSYARVLNKIINARRKSEKDVFKQGFSKGMKLGMKFEMMGWEPCTPKFADNTDDSSMWWSKIVNIKPSSFMKNQQRYLIPESERTFLVKKLYINQDGQMKADATHPNVSGSNVCMGDLRIDYSDENFDIQEVLVRAEELLDMINFDSAYRKDSLEHLLEVSEIQNSLFAGNEDINLKIRKSTSIRELDTSYDDDDDEEVIEDMAPIIHNISDCDGVHIAEMTRYPSNINIREREDVETQMINHLESQPVNLDSQYIEESIIVNDISTVDESGNNKPLVFNVGIGPVVQSPVDGFSLGDHNLMTGATIHE